MDFSTPIITKTAEETKNLGRTLAHHLKIQNPKSKIQNQLLCLYGELGSGKTTFVQGFAEGLGITERLLSPTFVILRSYSFDAQRNFHHLDLYRLEKEQLSFLGDIFQEKDSIIAIEWPERLGSDLPKQRLDLYFSVVNDGHKIAFKDHYEVNN